LTSQGWLVFVIAMLATGSAYVTVASLSGFFSQSPIAAAFSIVGSTDGFPRESNGGWSLHFVGNDPTPEGCKNLVNTTFNQGYSLETYVSSNAVKAGGLVCIDVVLQNVNGTVVTWGHSDELLTAYRVTDSSGQVFNSFTCYPTVPPPGQGPGADVPRPDAGCSGIWDTSASSSAGVVPQPGSYQIVASASYPGIGANTTATAKSSADFVVLAPWT
jgi:hypothetical protein